MGNPYYEWERVQDISETEGSVAAQGCLAPGMFMFLLFLASPPISWGDLTSLRRAPSEDLAHGQLPVSQPRLCQAPSAHRQCLLAISRLDWDPKLPKKVVPKLGFPGSVSLPKLANCSGQSSQMLSSGSLS